MPEPPEFGYSETQEGAMQSLDQALATIKALEARLAQAEAERDRWQRHSQVLGDERDKLVKDQSDLFKTIKTVSEDLIETRADRDRWLEVVAEAGVEFQDERVGYVALQIDRGDWLEAREGREEEHD